jgi:hypothetical protein
VELELKVIIVGSADRVRTAAAFKDNSAKDVTAFALIYGLMTLVGLA